jgi:hypothetical protein
LGVFGTGFLLRTAFDSTTPTALVWFGYGGLGLLGLVFIGVGIVTARRSTTD